MPLPANGLVTLSTDIAFKSEHFFSEFNRPIEGADSYTIVDAALRYSSGDGRITAAFWAKNLTDKLVASGTFPQASGRIIGVNYLPPRTYGFTLGYNF